MFQDQESSDEGAVKRRRERCMELAAMFKEIKSGSDNVKKSLIAKFTLQEGVSKRKAQEYFGLLQSSGLIKHKYGHGHWVYDPKQEWDLFRVEV